tara:strand:- start:148 stop:651 length:504 start_codon:yes stop_codon:yes gene_type:complete
MSKLELQQVFDNTPVKSYKEKIRYIEDFLLANADGVNIIGSRDSLIYPDLWKYKHFFGDGIYVREMHMKKGQLGFSAIHKHKYAFFLLSGILQSSKEDGVEEFIAPCYVISPRGAKRVVYAVEDCVIVTVHANPTNTTDLEEIEKNNVVFNWKDYEKYLKDNNIKEL